MSQIITGLLGQVSDGERVRTYLFTTAPYHDPALATLIEYGTALAVIPANAGLSIAEQIDFQPQGGTSNVSISQIPLLNTEGEFDDWGGYILSGLEWTWGRGYADQPWADWFKCYFKGRGKPEFQGRDRIIITLRDWFAYMRQPVARQVFSADDVTNTRLINTTVPLVFGSAYQVKPLATEPQIQRYAVAANANDIPAVQAGGNPTTPVYEVVPLGFQLLQSPSLEITCDVSGPPIEGWEESDVLEGIGDFSSWTDGYPDGFDVSEDAPYAVISETVEGWARVENTAKVDGNTGWITAPSYVSQTNVNTGDAWVPVGAAELADVLAGDDGTYARLQTQSSNVVGVTGAGWAFGLTPDVEPVGVESRVTFHDPNGSSASLYHFYMRLPNGEVRSLKPFGVLPFPSTKATEEWGGQTDLPSGLTKAMLEDPDFEVYAAGRWNGGGPADMRLHEIALKIHYGTVVDRLRLTSKDDLLTPGNRYLLRIYTKGAAGDSIKGYWGGVGAHSAEIPISDNPFAQTSAQLEGEDVHEFIFTAGGTKFAIAFDRGAGTANGEQSIERIELIDKSASRERFKDLQRYLHELFDKDPDEVCDNDALQLVQTQAGNPRLGDYVDDQTTAEQLSTHWAHSLGAAAWGGLHRKWTAKQMRVPQQPDGPYLSVVGSFGPGNAYPDTGPDLRDRVHAARNEHPLRDSETAGVTTTWPEEQRQLTLPEWRITEKADWSNLVGFPTLSVSGIDPATGDTAGGTSVTITGTGFESGATVSIGGNAATNVTVVSSTEITCDTPAGTAGTVDVIVTVGDNSATLAGGFEYTAAWTPANITTALWLDASDSATITKDGSGNWEQWDDKSGNDRHATQASASNRPADGSLGGLTAADFSGSAVQMTVPRGFISSAFTVAMVHSQGSGQNQRLIDQRSTGAFGSVKGWFLKNRNTDDAAGADDGAGNYRTTHSLTVSADAVRVSVFPEGGTVETYLDGTNAGTHQSGGSVPADLDNASNDVAIGGNADGSSTQDFDGLIGEVVVASSAVSEADRQKLEGYLAHKWGLEANLPAGHPYKSSPP